VLGRAESGCAVVTDKAACRLNSGNGVPKAHELPEALTPLLVTVPQAAAMIGRGVSSVYVAIGLSKNIRSRSATPRQISFVVSNKAANARRKFLRIFPRGFRDETYIDWERCYKREAHRKWEATLPALTFSSSHSN
jgi:hypothetical protein